MGTRVPQMRLGVKGGEINVLYRTARKPEKKRACLTMVLAVLGSVLGSEPVFCSESPLEHCWKQASTRIELQPCLRSLLHDAQRRLLDAQAKVNREAAELDRVSGSGTRNVMHARESDGRWRAYRRSECDRQAASMSPGTGSGDMLLACRILLTNERVRHLEMP